jgi:hypothetical protein
MNKGVTVTGEFDMHRPFDDLGLTYAMRPLYRITFELEQATIERLAQRFSDRIYRSYRRVTANGLELATLVLRFDDETFVMAMASYSQRGEVYAPSAERAEIVYRQLEPILKECAVASKPAFYMLRCDGNDISAEEITDVPEPLADDLMTLYYGRDINEWIQGFDRHTRNKIGGITILEGVPGTGKTTLVSQLVVRLTASHVFYVLPVGNDRALTSPELVPFWVGQNEQHPDKVKVIVMEDAERVLLRRDVDNQNSISALLNIADGLMGRMLRLHLVCSLNGQLDEIDPAILRPGRLLSYRRFGLLSKENATAIARARGVSFEPARGHEGFTLAEVLNPSVVEQPSQEVRIGF